MKLDLLHSQVLVLYPIHWHYTCLHRVTKKLCVNQVVFQWNILTFKRLILQISSIIALILFIIQFLKIALAGLFTRIVRIHFRKVSNNFYAGKTYAWSFQKDDNGCINVQKSSHTFKHPTILILIILKHNKAFLLQQIEIKAIVTAWSYFHSWLFFLYVNNTTMRQGSGSCYAMERYL